MARLGATRSVLLCSLRPPRPAASGIYFVVSVLCGVAEVLSHATARRTYLCEFSCMRRMGDAEKLEVLRTQPKKRAPHMRKTSLKPNKATARPYGSSHHLFSSRTLASSSGEKSLTMLKTCRICSGVLPLIMEATLAHVRSRSGLMSIKLAAKISAKSVSCSRSTKAASHSGTTCVDESRRGSHARCESVSAALGPQAWTRLASASNSTTTNSTTPTTRRKGGGGGALPKTMHQN